MHDVLVVGGGFAGMWAALSAAREINMHGAQHRVALISADPNLTVRPRLYETNPRELRTPLRPVLEQAGVTFIQGTVDHIDPAQNHVALQAAEEGAHLSPYRRLVLATGSVASVPPVPGMADYCWSIDNFEAAIAFDEHLESVVSRPKNSAPCTMAIIGGGFTGIELACEMRDRIAAHAGGEIAAAAHIVLLEQAPDIGPDLGPGPRPAIQNALDEARIDVRTNAVISAVENDRIIFANGTHLNVDACVLTTGMRAHIPVGLDGCEKDGMGRLITETDLRVSSAPAIFAAGDCAHGLVDDTHVALMSCQHAMPMGRFAGYNAVHDLLGNQTRAYRQPFYQTCLDLGRSGAVLTHGWDRQVQKTGDEAGALKRNINTKWIYPPAGSRDDIFQVADIDFKAAR